MLTDNVVLGNNISGTAAADDGLTLWCPASWRENIA